MAGLENQTFAGFEIIGELGRGGMGAVYKARQPKLDRLVALKIMSSDLAGDPEFVARFKREANAAAALNHENIVQVFSAGECEKTHYIAMEFVEGETLRHHIESQGRLDPREAVAITVLVAQALQYAWNKVHIIHRDIKPENIFLSHAGEVKVGDLGLAKTVGGGSTSLTQTGMMMGSPHYISPEQARGLSDIDFRTDIYSLGCTLYHMLTGRPPYTGTDPLVVINKHVNEPPPAIFKVWPTCPIPLALLVGKMLAKQRHERPASYEDLIEQLHELHGKLKPATAVAPASASEPKPVPAPQPTVAKTPKPAPKARDAESVIRNSRIVIGVGALAAVALIAGAVWWFAGHAGEGADKTKVLNLGDGVKMELVAIPPGEFLFGNNPSRKAAIRDEFWLGRTEVTVGQWKQFVGATGYQTHAEKNNGAAHWCPQGPGKGTVGAGSKGTNWRTLNVGFALQDNHPVACLTWGDAMAFCEWLTERERKAGRLRAGYVLRLPTEAEWEYACRAGTTTKFWWGDDVNDGEGRVNWGGTEDGFEFMSPVDHFGERGRNQFGLADMLGNVAELCLDCYDESGTSGTPRCAPRGGSFAPGRGDCSTRNPHARSELPYGTEGFRVCLGMDVLGSAAVSVSNPPPVTPADDAAWIPLDISAACNRSLIRTEPEKPGQSFGLTGNTWVTTGWARARGRDKTSVPDDGRVAIPGANPTGFCRIHVGPGNNSIFFSIQSHRDRAGDIPTTVTLDVPASQQRKFARLAFLHASEPGDAEVSVTIHYDTGTDGEGALHPRAWNHNFRKEPLTENETVAIKASDASGHPVEMMAEILPVDPQRVLKSLTFTFASVSPKCKDPLAAEKCRAGIFAISALPTAPSTPTLQHSTASATADAGWQNAINLLPLVDIEKDKVSGTWTAANGELTATDVKAASQKLQPPYKPPEEYDYRVSFTPTGGMINVAAGLSVAGHSFVCLIKTNQADHLIGFEAINDKPVRDNTTGVSIPHLESGRRYTMTVEVRKEGVTAYLDGKRMTEWKTDYRDMGPWRIWKFNDDTLLGIGCVLTTAIFHEIKVREVTGKGTFTRGVPGASAVASSQPQGNARAFNGRRYQFVAGRCSWDEAKSKAEALDGHLAIITSKEEDEWVKQLLIPHLTRQYHCCWIGASRPKKEMSWQWITGEPFVFTAWGPGQPNYVGKRRLEEPYYLGYVLLNNAIAWNDVGSTESSANELAAGFLVEWDDASPSSAPSTAAWQNAINLLPLIDPQKDAVAGTWKLEAGALVSSSSGNTPLEIPYQPPEEYDFRVEFSLETKGGAVVQRLSKSGRCFVWLMGGHGGRIFGFDTVGGQPASRNPTRHELDLQCDRRYISVVGVRNGQVTASLDGSMISAWKTDYQDMGTPNWWKSRDRALLGVGSYNGRIVFHRIEVREVTGKGTFTRGVPSNSSSTPTLQHSNLPAALSAFCAEVAALPAEQQVARVVAKLKELNPDFDPAKAKVAHKIEKNAVTELSFYAIGVTNIVPVAALTSLVKLACSGSTSERSPLEDLSPLRGLPLKVLDCNRTGVADLSPLRGMLLKSFNCSYASVTDLSPLRGMPLEYVGFYARPIEDLSPLADSPLVEIYCSPPLASRPENVKVLKSIPTLQTINGQSTAEFWTRAKAGEVPKP